MRLSEHEKAAIRSSFEKVFGSGEIYLFGSRADDSKRGGDIDLYIVTQTSNLAEKKLDFLVTLKRLIGEQKIDVVFNRDCTRAIEREAKLHGVVL